MNDWGHHAALIAELWPDWKPTESQRTEFRDRLEHKNAAWLESAIRDHYALDTPRDGVFISPRLSKILARYSEIATAGEHERQRTAPASSSRFRAAWTVERNGTAYRIASANTFGSTYAAIDYAARQGTHPDAMPVDGHGTNDESEVHSDHRNMLADMLTWTPGRLAEATEEAKKRFQEFKPPAVAFLDWPRYHIGVVWSVDRNRNKESRQ